MAANQDKNKGNLNGHANVEGRKLARFPSLYKKLRAIKDLLGGESASPKDEPSPLTGCPIQSGQT